MGFMWSCCARFLRSEIGKSVVRDALDIDSCLKYEGVRDALGNPSNLDIEECKVGKDNAIADLVILLKNRNIMYMILHNQPILEIRKFMKIVQSQGAEVGYVFSDITARTYRDVIVLDLPLADPHAVYPPLQAGGDYELMWLKITEACPSVVAVPHIEHTITSPSEPKENEAVLEETV
jgi:hypothetical protein